MRIATASCSGLRRFFSGHEVLRSYPILSVIQQRALATDSNSLSEKNSTRLSKLLSQHATNLSMSRREAERLIKTGQVTIAGQVVTSPMMLIDMDSLQGGALQLGGKAVHLRSNNEVSNDVQKTRVWIVHKLPGEVVADSDPHGRPSMMQRLTRGGVGKQKGKARLHLKPVGRLDIPTEGLILVTNDGKYAREMELPSNQLHRTYRVRTHGFLSVYKLSRIRRGLAIEGVRYPPMKVELETKKRAQATNQWLKVTCTEGKNRQVRTVLKYLGLQVTRLIRISYGDYQLQTIPPGMAVEVPTKRVNKQRHRGPLFSKRKSIATEEKDESASPVQWIRNL